MSVQVKVCGITTLEDALMCVEAGADALGFNFYPRSPRYINPEKAFEIVQHIPMSTVSVGLFVNESAEHISRVARIADIAHVQLHGGETPDGLIVWRAINVGPEFHADLVENDSKAKVFVLDSPAPGVYGGTGVPFDWTTLPILTRKVVLAGGLDASNVSEAIRIVDPWGVDACSRLEIKPGVKDARKVAAFIAAAKEYDI